MARQVGGDHYAGKYQHWDWVVDTRLPYLPATATKYIARWRRKNGRQDLEKSVTYLEKMRETGVWSGGVMPFANGIGHNQLMDVTQRLGISTDMEDWEINMCYKIANIKRDADALTCLIEVKRFMEELPVDTEEAAARHIVNG